jgi:hypothetical protein
MTTQIENFTNNKLANYYKNAKLDYNVVGSATTKIEDNKITIKCTENGVDKVWSMAFYKEYVLDNGLDYFFNVWMEEQN